MNMFKLVPNFEMTMYLAQATGACIVTDRLSCKPVNTHELPDAHRVFVSQGFAAARAQVHNGASSYLR